MARLAAEHFCALWPNAERTRSRMAWSRSARAVMIRLFLPLVSANRRSAGIHARIGDQRAAHLTVGARNVLQHLPRNPGLPQGLGKAATHEHRLRRGLE